MCPQLDPREVDSVILERAMAQHGVVSRAQLREAGIADGSLKHRLRRGRLHRLHRGVYAVGHPMLTWEGRLMAALLACGGGAVASHRTAGDVWGLRPSARRKVDVTVPSHAGRAPPGAVSLHRSTTLLEWERTLERGIPVTTPARTLLDIAALMDRRSLKGTVERAETLRIFDLGAVQAVLAAHPRQAGSAALRAVLAQWTEPDCTRSELEAQFMALCRREGIELPRVNAMVGPYEVDFLWPRQRVVVEVDGHRHHGTRAAFERDRARDARLTAAGHRVVRFTYRVR